MIVFCAGFIRERVKKKCENHIQDENHLMVACPISSPGDDRNESMEDL